MSRAGRVALAIAVSGAALVPWATSCADASDDGAPVDPPVMGTVLPEGGSSAFGDAASDAAACDGDASCIVAPPCTARQLCVVPTGVTKFYSLAAIWGSSKNDIWAVGSGGTIIRYDGTAWKPAPTTVPLKNTFHVVGGSGPNDVWVASTDKTLFHSTGASGGTVVWTAEDPPPKAVANSNDIAFYSMLVTPSEVRLGANAVSLDFSGPVDQYTRLRTAAPPSWDEGRGPQTLRGMWAASENDLWLVGDNAGQFAPSYVGHATRTLVGGPFTITSLEPQSALPFNAVWGSSAADVWAVGEQGQIRRFTPALAYGDVIASPTTEALHAIWGAAPNKIWAAGDNGTVLFYDGTSWKPASAVFPSTPKPNFYGIWGSSADDVWVVGDVALHLRADPTTAGGAP